MAITHSTPADVTFTPPGRAAWDAGHTGSEDFTQSGAGAISGTALSQLRKLTFLSDWTTSAQFDTARDALTGTVGLPPKTEVTHALNTDDYPFYIKTANTASADFGIAIGDATFNSTVDTTMSFGYNPSAGGGRRDTNDPAWFLSFEADYEVTPGTHYMECHFQGVHADGTTFRNWSWFVDHSTKTIEHSQNANRFSWYDATGVNQFMVVNNINTTAALVNLNSGTSLRHTVNNVNWLQQQNAAGNGAVEIARINASDQVVLAPAGGTVFTTGKVALTSAALGSTAFDCFSSASGTLAIFQKNNTTSGQDVVRVTLGSAITGTAQAFYADGSTTSTLQIGVQQNGDGLAVFNAMVLGTGDAQSVYSIFSGQAWAVGLDNSASDAFKIAASNSLGTSDALIISTGGAVTIPNLAGTGSRTVVADANGLLSAP